MMVNKKILIVLFFLTNAAFAQDLKLLPARTILSDDAFPVDLYYLEGEIGGSLIGNNIHVPVLLKYCPIKLVELGIFLDGIHDFHEVDNPSSALGNYGAQIKWQNYSDGNIHGALIAAVGFYPNAKADLVTYYSLSAEYKRFMLNYHLGGYLTDDDERGYKGIVTYAVSAISKTTGKIAFFGEIHGELNSPDLSPHINAGIIYALTDVCAADLGIDTSPVDIPGSLSVNFGITYGFGFLK